jgi:hypothetical protein
MRIDQRNAGASITQTNANIFSTDRWQSYGSQASKMTLQQSSTAPTGFTKSLLITSSSAYAITTSDIFIFRQQIEGLNFSDLEWGTTNAKTVTLSFWVRSSITGTWGGSLFSTGGTQSYPFSYTISTANTWQQITITASGPTTGGATTDNSSAAQVIFGLGVGSTNAGTAGSWSSSVLYSATGATSLVGTNAATWYITGVQLEVGSSATPFERRLYGQEFINCQRYYQSQLTDIGNSAILSGNVTNAASYYGSKTFQVAMRAAPTLTWGTQWGVNGFASTAPTADWLGADGFRFYKASNATTNGGYIFQAWTASAEL